MSALPPIRFGVIGIDHPHIYSQTKMMLSVGATLVSYITADPKQQADFAKAFPQGKAAASADAILEDPSIQLILTAGVPSERAGIAIQAMRHGKDVMSDKPGVTTFDQLAEVRRVQAETGRIYSIDYAERLENRATTRGLQLVLDGAIGQVVNTVGLGPHLRRFHTRPPWFFERAKFGGILIDIASHQCDQFLCFTQATEAEVECAHVANRHHPQYPEFEDFGDVHFRTPNATGYVRVDWFTPDGLASWGDTRLTVIGTDGYIEVRKNIDIAGRPGSDHLFLVDHQGTQYFDCSQVELPYGRQLVHDILHRTETAMSQEHCYRAMDLALTAQAKAVRSGNLSAA
jgi:predicted dehydrogenase